MGAERNLAVELVRRRQGWWAKGRSAPLNIARCHNPRRGGAGDRRRKRGERQGHGDEEWDLGSLKEFRIN